MLLVYRSSASSTHKEDCPKLIVAHTVTWSSPAQSFLASGLVEIYDQHFCSLLDMHVFRSGAPVRQGEGSVFLFRNYVLHCSFSTSEREGQ
jgi:hypothetical protein